MEKAIRERIKEKCENNIKGEGIVLFLDEFKGKVCKENYIGGLGYKEGGIQEILEEVPETGVDESYNFEVEVVNTEREKALNFKFQKKERIILIDISKRLANQC